MDLSAPRSESLDIIAFQTAKNKLIGINPMVLSAPRTNSLVIIALQTV